MPINLRILKGTKRWKKLNSITQKYKSVTQPELHKELLPGQKQIACINGIEITPIKIPMTFTICINSVTFVSIIK